MWEIEQPGCQAQTRNTCSLTDTDWVSIDPRWQQIKPLSESVPERSDLDGETDGAPVMHTDALEAEDADRALRQVAKLHDGVVGDDRACSTWKGP